MWSKTPTSRRRIHKNQIKYLIELDYCFRALESVFPKKNQLNLRMRHERAIGILSRLKGRFAHVVGQNALFFRPQLSTPPRAMSELLLDFRMRPALKE